MKAQSARRVRSIDAFRGLGILLMVFFTLLARLSSPPEPLQHNVPGSLHAGDFVLPMFLFASGMSLVFYRKKRQGATKLEYALDVVGRFGGLVLVSFLLSPFSAGRFFGMDEVMLSALLFLPCVLMLALPDLALVAAMAAIAAAYAALASLAMLPDFYAAYLGGYPAAPFWLPVMLGGVLAGRRVAEGREYVTLIAASALATAALLAAAPPWKADASPSFMAFSITLSLLLYAIIDRFVGRAKEPAGFVEYVGARPIRYWVLMFALFVIPMDFYAMLSGAGEPLGIGWAAAAAFSLACMPILWLASKGMDMLPPLPRILNKGPQNQLAGAGRRG